jgi:hypothetical protein
MAKAAQQIASHSMASCVLGDQSLPKRGAATAAAAHQEAIGKGRGSVPRPMRS